MGRRQCCEQKSVGRILLLLFFLASLSKSGSVFSTTEIPTRSPSPVFFGAENCLVQEGQSRALSVTSLLLTFYWETAPHTERKHRPKMFPCSQQQAPLFCVCRLHCQGTFPLYPLLRFCLVLCFSCNKWLTDDITLVCFMLLQRNT